MKKSKKQINDAHTVTSADLPLLRRARLFRGVTEETVTASLSLLGGAVRLYEKNETVHRMGERFSAFGIVLGGNIQVYTDDLDGNRMMMAAVSAGGSFGESHCYLGTEEPPVYVLAGHDGARVLWLSLDPLRSIPLTASALVRDLAERFTAMLAENTLLMNARIQILSRRTLREKIMTFLLEWSRYTGERTFLVPFDREGLAAYLAVNRTALSRELSLMQKEGIIHYFRASFKIL